MHLVYDFNFLITVRYRSFSILFKYKIFSKAQLNLRL